MVLEGMDIARFNLSHSSPSQHLRIIRKIRRISKKLDIPIGIMVDLPGAKLRLGFLKRSVYIKENQRIILKLSKYSEGSDYLPVPYKIFFATVQIRDTVLLDDGKVELKVVDKKSKYLICRAKNEGEITSHKSLHIKGKSFNFRIPTSQDLHLIKIFASHVDFISLSYIKNAQELKKAKKIIKAINPHCFVVSKIETPQGLRNLRFIIPESDVVMVARGDLGLEVDLVKLAFIQKKIIKECKMNLIPVIVATQILESMVNNPLPHRSEVTDIYNAVLDGVDALLLSGETSVGRYPIRAVRFLRKICLNAERSKYQLEGVFKPLFLQEQALAEGILNMSRVLKADKIVVYTDDISIVKIISLISRHQDTIVVVSKKKLLPLFNIFFGCQAFAVKGKNISIQKIKKYLENIKMVSDHKKYPFLIFKKSCKLITVI